MWGKFLDDWPHVAPGTHAAIQLENEEIIYIPIMYLAGPLGEGLTWLGGFNDNEFHKS